MDCIDERITAGLDFHVAAVNDPVYGDLLKAGKQAPEIIYTEALGPELTKLPESVKILVPYENIDVAHVYNRNAVALIGVREFLTLEEGPEGNGVFVEIRGVEEINQELAVKLQREEEAILVLTPTEVLYSDYRHLLERLAELNIKNRVIIRAVASGEEIDDLNLRVALMSEGYL